MEWDGWTIYWLARRGANRDRGNKLQSIYIDQIIIVLPFAPSFAVACGHSWHRPHLKPRTCREIVMMSMSSCGFSHYNQNKKKKTIRFLCFRTGKTEIGHSNEINYISELRGGLRHILYSDVKASVNSPMVNLSDNNSSDNEMYISYLPTYFIAYD